MQKLSLEELDKIHGGKIEDAQDYIHELMDKYGVDNTHDLNNVMTDEEWGTLFKLLGK